MSTNTANATARAALYRALAEALAGAPDWSCGPGYGWPLFTAAQAVADREDCAGLHQALPRLAAIRPEDLSKRQARYDALFSGAGRPCLWLYESLAVDGKLAGPSTLAVWSVYEAAGLIVADTELPDHASVELAFLAYLADQEAAAPDQAAQWHRARRLFIKRHAGQWLPALGEALSRTDDMMYGPVGGVLAAALRSDVLTRSLPRTARGLPVLHQPEDCTLCSFCVQVCPTRALAIRETDECTTLLLADSKCTGCERCVRVCMVNALRLAPAAPNAGQRVLRESPRARCPACGESTVSQAELDAVVARIGDPAWLHYCSDCRALVLESVP